MALCSRTMRKNRLSHILELKLFSCPIPIWKAIEPSCHTNDKMAENMVKFPGNRLLLVKPHVHMVMVHPLLRNLMLNCYELALHPWACQSFHLNMVKLSHHHNRCHCDKWMHQTNSGLFECLSIIITMKSALARERDSTLYLSDL